MDHPTLPLRHVLATMAYRMRPIFEAAADARKFGHIRVSPDSRTACEILAHMADLLD